MQPDKLSPQRLLGSVLASRTYYYDGEGNRITPDAIVNSDGTSSLTELDSDAATAFLPSAPLEDDKAAPPCAGSRLLTYTYDRVIDESLGHCRCGGQHPDGRFLSQDPIGFFADDPNLYRYVKPAPAENPQSENEPE